ncbi:MULTISPECIES: AsmA family protein [Sulfitobacter]|uniref:AsmA family protein n=1 Tax=Sulfitobacter TaxID=60136 RepID=UPI002306F456|nr:MULTISPECIES: AsmA family protein [Sulfitobacter]MDF3383322.1 AsmA family protein [Sulfitobacter sp. Ks11]MDF3386741.1 AsmA family protein [Sulfitobacter sp. M85]MDF3390160.1 AsmA family protein [Sulfitobacter sp. Ks16]MDF3400797.1 AsmA family protein [Sulfitobacter sp. KE39]MDF3404218.1 AsmA family protein [Sulfitobacter sp. Ks35]
MRWIIRVIGALLLIVVIMLGALFLLPGERIARIASDQLSRMTGREVSITGDVGVTLWPVLGVTAGGLEVGNADWTDKGALLTAANAAIGVDAGALLRGEIRITNIAAQSPVIRLEQRLDGRASWQFTDSASGARLETESAPNANRRPLSIQKLTVTDATLIYDAEGADVLRYDGVDLALDWPERGGAADITASMAPTGQAVQLAARIEGFADFLDGGVQPLRAEVTAGGGDASFDGRGSLDGALAGDLRVDSADTARFLASFGAGGINLPRGLGQSVDLRSGLTLTADRRLSLRNLAVDLGGNSLTGQADLALNGTPRITANLRTGALDLSALSEETGETKGADSTTTADAEGWSQQEINADWLAAFDGNIALSAESIDLEQLDLGPTRAVLRNERARMVFDLQDMNAYGGKVAGEFVMNNRDGLSVGGRLQAQNVQMRDLLEDAAGVTRFTGAGDADLSFLGVGQSIDAIMRSLSGSGALTMGRGTIAGIDLDALLGSVDAEGGSTVFDSVEATFEIAKGVLRNDDLLMLLPNFNATGAGQVDLGAQRLDYTVTPKALRVNASRGGLAVPVRIRGPWADPEIKADLRAAIDLNFAEEKQRAEDVVRQKIQEELNIAPDDNRSTEDIVKDELENAVRRELFKLFD